MARGIASLVDTLFLMLITAGAMAIIFYAAYHYGSSVQGELDRLVAEFYTRQVLKSLSAYTIDRDGVPDYLLAYMKEDVYNYKDLKGSAEYLKDFLSDALSLLSDAYDYALLFRIESSSGDVGDVSVYYVLGRMYTADNDWNHWEEKDFSCSLGKEEFDSFKQAVLKLPGVISSYTVFFFKVKTNGDTRYYPAYVTLILWPSGVASAKVEGPCGGGTT